MTRKIDDLHYIAHQLDSRFRGPLGFRFGWDGLLGLFPGVGDLITSSFSFYIIMRAAIIGVPPVIIARMGLNVLIDNLGDKVPLFGLLFDFVWKANEKNVKLLNQAIINEHRTTWQSRLWVTLVLFFIFAVFFGTVFLGFYLLFAAFEYLRNLQVNV